jgi:hypothetical protein
VTTATCEHLPHRAPPLAAAETAVLPPTQGLLGRLLHWALNVEQAARICCGMGLFLQILFCWR